MGVFWNVIRTPADLLRVQKTVVQTALRIVSEQSVILLKNIAAQQMALGGSDWYNRSGEFEQAWGLIEENVNQVVIGYMEDKITPLLADYQHGNPYSGAFVGDDLAAAILNGYEVFDTGVGVPARDIWGEFIEQFNVMLPQWLASTLGR